MKKVVILIIKRIIEKMMRMMTLRIHQAQSGVYKIRLGI
jgi:hypothetical protein